jgi:hypothetical protein
VPKSAYVKTEEMQTATVQRPMLTDTTARRDTTLQMVVTQYGVRFVETDSPDRSPLLLGLASLGPCLARVTQTVLVAATRLRSVESASRKPVEVSRAGSDKTPSGQDPPRARWSSLRRRPNLDKVGR